MPGVNSSVAFVQSHVEGVSWPYPCRDGAGQSQLPAASKSWCTEVTSRVCDTSIPQKSLRRALAVCPAFLLSFSLPHFLFCFPGDQ